MRAGIAPVIVAFLTVAFFNVALAAEEPVGDVRYLKINEICPAHVQGVSDEEPGAWIELFNPYPDGISTRGMKIADADLNLLASIPPLTIPPQGYLVVYLGVGVNDLDPSDGVAIIHAGRTEETSLPWDSGAVGLFKNKVGAAGALRDFVAWGTRSLDASRTEDLAIERAIWTRGAFFDLTYAPAGSSFGLAVNGLDSDALSAIAFFSGRYDAGLPSPGGPNRLQSFPRPGEVKLDSGVPAGWVTTEIPYQSTTYRVKLDRIDAHGNRQNLYQDETWMNHADFPAPECGEYAWKVDPCGDGIPLGVSTEFSFFKPLREEGEIVDLPVPFLLNRKDTGMLCTYDLSSLTRPGCDDTRWNLPHTPETANAHDAAYSARASIAMVNRYFGGDLSQDRISYQIWKTKYAGAEGDLGHGVGFKTVDVTTALRWSLNGAMTQYGAWAPGFDYIKQEIDAGQPVVVSFSPAIAYRECAVIAGYVILTLYNGGPPMPAVHVLDPRAGTHYWILYSFFSPSITGYWGITAETVTATLQETSVTADSDADGIVDFDETATNDRFDSLLGSGDSDSDGISDFLEIYCYTFHDAMHAGHANDSPGFADPEGDGLRSEADLDSDGGGRADNLEDIDLDGIAPEAGETCPLLMSDDGGMPRGLPGGPQVAIGRSAAGFRIRLDLPRGDRVDADLFAPDGRRIAELASGEMGAGSHEVVWDGRLADGTEAPRGVYLVRIATAGSGRTVAKLIRLD